jgi:hypothetical protein
MVLTVKLSLESPPGLGEQGFEERSRGVRAWAVAGFCRGEGYSFSRRCVPCKAAGDKGRFRGCRRQEGWWVGGDRKSLGSKCVFGVGYTTPPLLIAIRLAVDV